MSAGLSPASSQWIRGSSSSIDSSTKAIASSTVPSGTAVQLTAGDKFAPSHVLIESMRPASGQGATKLNGLDDVGSGSMLSRIGESRGSEASVPTPSPTNSVTGGAVGGATVPVGSGSDLPSPVSHAPITLSAKPKPAPHASKRILGRVSRFAADRICSLSSSCLLTVQHRRPPALALGSAGILGLWLIVSRC